jgi:hypothetical protein
MVSGFIQCFHFREKRGRVITYFRRGKEHARRLMVPVHRGGQRMQRCGGVRRLPESMTSGLTRGGRQSVGRVRSKGCLGQILLQRLNMLLK